MSNIEQNLVNWRKTLVASIPVGGLLSRNPIVYKWKAPFRCWLLREAAFWRINDLLSQSYDLHQRGHALGARILLRSSFETLATLIYMNQLTTLVLDGALDFHVYGQKTATLLTGSRDGSTAHKSLNIITVLDKCDKRYPGIRKLYEALSESAHPNYEGLLRGYSVVDRDEYETKFSNRWVEIYGSSNLHLINLCMESFHTEYDVVWADQLEKFETWIEENDAKLEATKNNEPTDK